MAPGGIHATNPAAALADLVTFINDQDAPDAIVASGTIIRGQPSPGSDFDMVAILGTPGFFARELLTPS